ncbi:MAG: spermidine/putrescine ABC transporter substrate-binding protein [Clostridia bacterium]|nr:spermidine/putrescine ABC transporter substrate-binding protein [Clostridia bacterium]
MKRVFALLLITLTLLVLVCPISAEDELPAYSTDYDWDRLADQNITLNVYNWGEYISVDDGEEDAFDTIAEFEALTGIKVNYTNFASNEELYAKLKNGGSSYDIIIPSEYMVARMINEGMLEMLNLENIPNIRHLDPSFVGLEHDPNNRYSVAYMWGTVGIIYNKTLVDEEDDVETWDILWNEKYANDILMFSNSRDAFGIALKKLGYSYNTTDEAELNAAAEALKEQKLLVQAYVMDEIFDKMGGGEAALAPYYAGDAITMIAENPDLAFAVPREGTNLFVDSMCIPKGAKNKEAAEIFINFMCEPKVGVYNCYYIGYSTPSATVKEYLDAEIVEDPIAYPAQEVLDKAEVYLALPEATTKLIDNLWTEVLGTAGSSPWMVPAMMLGCIGASLGINLWRARKKRRNGQ